MRGSGRPSGPSGLGSTSLELVPPPDSHAPIAVVVFSQPARTPPPAASTAAPAAPRRSWPRVIPDRSLGWAMRCYRSFPERAVNGRMRPGVKRGALRAPGRSRGCRCRARARHPAVRGRGRRSAAGSRSFPPRSDRRAALGGTARRRSCACSPRPPNVCTQRSAQRQAASDAYSLAIEARACTSFGSAWSSSLWAAR